MTKIARPALSNAIHFFKQEWRGIVSLSIRTYITMIVIYMLFMIPAVLLMGSDVFFKMTHTSVLNLPPQALAGQLLLGLCSTMAIMWLHVPLYVSISRGVILKQAEAFDRTFFSRLLSPRTLQVTKVLALMVLLMIPFDISVLFLGQSMTPGESAISPGVGIMLGIFFLTYFIVYCYASLRLVYLIPAFAVDRQFENLAEAWDATQGKAWPILKVGLLTGFIAIIGFIVIVIANLLFGGVILLLSMATGAGGLGILSGIIIGIVAILSFVGFYLIFPQLMTAAIASFYSLTQPPSQEAIIQKVVEK